MRKVLSFVLVLSLVLGSFGMAFAATTPSKTALSDISGKNCEDAVRVLTELDVVSGYADGTYKPDATVTRAEMASLVIKGLGLKETNAIPKFKDSQTHWAKGYIAYANTLGIISGRTATTFDPDATVTYDEATTMLIKALGYTDEALVGTYPASFVSRARVLGILDNVKTGSGAANRGDVAVMLYQTIDQAIGKVDKDGNFQSTVTKYDKDGKAKEYDTMLARLGAEVASKDTLSGVAGWRPDVDENAFVVSGDEDTLINITPYKGAVVTAYVNSDDDIIAIKEVFTTFVTGNFDNNTNGAGAFDSDTIFSLADGTEYTLQADALKQINYGAKVNETDAVTFVNGDRVTISTLDRKTNGNNTAYTMAVELSGKKISDIYSVLSWKISDADRVSDDQIKDIETNHKLLGVAFPEDSNNAISNEDFELIGVNSLSGIQKEDVVYVYKNKDDEIARVAVGSADATGAVTKVNSGQSKITIDGKDYKYATLELFGNNPVDAVSNTKIKADDEVVIYLDAYGYIYDYSKTAGTADKFAIILKSGNSNGIDSNAQLKLFLADGTVKTFDVDEDEMPAEWINGDNWAAGVTTGILSTGTLVKYGIDKSGVISSLVAADNEDEDLIFGHVAKEDITKKGYYDGKEIASDAVIFNYDGSGAFGTSTMSNDGDDYGVAAFEKILDSSDVEAFYAYDTDSKEIVSLLMNNVTSGTDIYGVIVGKGTNNSDAGAYYNMLIDGKAVPYNGDDAKISTAKKMANALAIVKLDATGDVKDFEPWHNSGDKVKKVEMKPGSDANIPAVNNSTVTFKSSQAVEYYNDGILQAAPANINTLTLDKDVVVYVYSKVADEWQLGTTGDLRDLKKADNLAFYDVQDEDNVYDVVLVNKAGNNTGDTVVTTGEVITVSAITTSGISFSSEQMTTLNSTGRLSMDVTSSASIAAIAGGTVTASAVSDKGTVNVSTDFTTTSAYSGVQRIVVEGQQRTATYTISYMVPGADNTAITDITVSGAAVVATSSNRYTATLNSGVKIGDIGRDGIKVTPAGITTGAAATVKPVTTGTFTVTVTAGTGVTAQYSVVLKEAAPTAPDTSKTQIKAVTVTVGAITGGTTTLGGIVLTTSDHVTAVIAEAKKDQGTFIYTDPTYVILAATDYQFTIEITPSSSYEFTNATVVTVADRDVAATLNEKGKLVIKIIKSIS